MCVAVVAAVVVDERSDVAVDDVAVKCAFEPAYAIAVVGAANVVMVDGHRDRNSVAD